MTDPHRLQQRQRQIDIGKNTPGYQHYVQSVARNARTPEMPRTPDKFQVCSKRSWDGQVKKWRRLLHAFDERKPGAQAAGDKRDGSPAVELDARSERKLTRMIDDVVATELGLTPRKTSAAAMIASAAAVATPPPPHTGGAERRAATDRAAQPVAAAQGSAQLPSSSAPTPAAAPAAGAVQPPAPASSVASPSPLSPRFAASSRATSSSTPAAQLDADAMLDSADDLDDELLFDSDDDIFALADNLQA